MRLNLPVTQREIPLPAGGTLVSVTDLKGRITYCNPGFEQVCGYSRAELLGQPHNLIRHPDVPAEAFRDLWDTVAAGRPWTGVVKNRARNGDHYWVRANVTPMKNGGEIVGYLSVRTAPSREEIDASEALFARMRAEAEQGRRVHVLDGGRLRRRDSLGRLLGLVQLPQAARLALLVLATAVVPAAAVQWAGTWGWLALPVVLAAAGHALRRVTFGALGQVLADANRLAAGDLSRPIATGAPGFVGDLQRSLAQLAVNLRSIIIDTRAEIARVRQAASEIASGNQDLSQRTEAQAASLRQTAGSVADIEGTVQRCVDSAVTGVQQATRTAEATQLGDASVQGAAETMGAIHESSRRIEQIIGAVDDVAFQTNILALNAAVEAARAGEAGRGFAVVAAEVRALAQRSSASAREIKSLIAESSERVAAGADRVGTARERMEAVLTDVGAVTRSLHDIQGAAQAQQRGLAHVCSAVAQMQDITQRNAALVEQLAQSAAELDRQVEVVDSSLHIFRLREGDTTVAEIDAVALRRQARAGSTAA